MPRTGRFLKTRFIPGRAPALLPARALLLAPALLPALALLLSPAALLPGGRGAVALAASAAPAGTEIAPGRVVVAFDGPGRAERFLRDRAAPLGLVRHHTVRGLPAEVLTVPAGEEETWAARLRAEAGVRYAEPDVVVRAAHAPDDPLFFRQWNMRTREGVPPSPVADQPNEAENIWNWRHDSADLLLAVIDSGADTTHADLDPNLFRRPADPPDGLDNDGNGFVDDTRGWNFIDDDRNIQEIGRASCRERV